jgi:predicted N-acetyltransferase YhbS
MAEPAGWHCLGPVAVWPDWQNGALWRGDPASPLRDSMRFGTRIVAASALPYTGFPRAFRPEQLPADGKPTLVARGKPLFLARCGFSRDRAARLISDHPVGPLLIARAGADVPEARLAYPAAFQGL